MRRAANLGLSLLVAGMIATALAVAAIPAATGTHAVTIDRNSMQALLPAGSLAYIHQQANYDVGDIVTFRHNGDVITHQIADVLPNPANKQLDHTLFQTKGTSNREIDPFTIPTDAIVGRVVAQVPVAGLVVKSLGSLPVEIFLASLALGLYLLGRPADRRRPDPVPAPA